MNNKQKVIAKLNEAVSTLSELYMILVDSQKSTNPINYLDSEIESLVDDMTVAYKKFDKMFYED